MANVVLVVDMLKGFHDTGNLANPRTARIIPIIRALLEKKVKQEGNTAIFLGDSHKKNDAEFQMFPPHCIEGTEEEVVVKELEEFYASGVDIPKTTYSGFYDTDLEELLEFENPKEVIVVGVCTDICVLITALELRIRGYSVTVLEDCVETFDAPGHEAEKVNQWALDYMRSILGVRVVISSKELL